MRVQATQRCFIDNRLREAGEVFVCADYQRYPFLVPVKGAPKVAPKLIAAVPSVMPTAEMMLLGGAPEDSGSPADEGGDGETSDDGSDLLD